MNGQTSSLKMETTKSPIVTVVMTTLNSGLFISEAVASILNQTLTDFELLILDGGSTDGTVEFVGSVNDARVRFFQFPGTHRGERLNLGIARARAELIAIMDSDDVAVPERLEHQVAMMTADPRLSIVGSWAYMVNEQGERIGLMRRPVQHARIAHQLFAMNGLCMGTSCFKKDLFSNGNRFSETLRFEDLDWLARIEPVARFANLPEPLMHLRQRTQSRSRMTAKDDRTLLFDSLMKQFMRQLSDAGSARRRSDVLRNIGICSYYYADRKTTLRYLYRSFAAWAFSALTLRYLLVALFIPEHLLQRLRTVRLVKWLGLLLRDASAMMSVLLTKVKK